MEGGAGPGAEEDGDVEWIMKMRSAVRVLRKWRSYRDRRIFLYLKHAICRAEESLTHQVLRKINPMEASILRDPTLHARLRFRFGGEAFPPVILYKIFINANVQYVSGVTEIQPGSKAAYDSCEMMGDRKYFDLVLADIESQTPMPDKRLVRSGSLSHARAHASTTQDLVLADIKSQTPMHDKRLAEMQLGMQDRLKEYGNFDAHPTFLGGKGNRWRMLVDDRFSFNENALRFDPNMEGMSGKKLQILDQILTSLERSVLDRHAATPVPQMRKEFASQAMLSRIKTSQQRSRSRQMRLMYSQHLHDDDEEGGGLVHEGDYYPSNEELLAEDEAYYDVLRTTGGTGGGVSSHSATGPLDEESLDGATDSLLDWAGQLSFENYHEAWERTAATVVDLPL